MPCKGAVWQDLVMFAFTAEFQGGADADLLVRTHPMTRDISESSIDVVVLAGYAAYRWLAQRPVDPLCQIATLTTSLEPRRRSGGCRAARPCNQCFAVPWP